MKSLISCLTFVFICLLTVPSHASNRLSDSNNAASTSIISNIMPHKAEYTMDIASIKNGSSINNVSGKLDFEWRDVCDGWATQQHMDLHFYGADNRELINKSSQLTWESKDGKKYSFNIKATNNGGETDSFHGKANLGNGKNLVRYNYPEKKENVELAAGTMFPTAHTLLTIQKAMAGEKYFTRRVFDGADDEGSSEISVFIGSSTDIKDSLAAQGDLKDNPLLNHKAWPVRMAFFNPQEHTSIPDYEMEISLLPNGVVNSMRLDYGDFSISGTLTKITFLPSGC